MVALQTLPREFMLTVLNGEVWLSIGEALVVGLVAVTFGIWVARLVGLLATRAPTGETFGVGLASGLVVLAAWWAAIWSAGRSSFTPVAIGLALAVAMAVVRRRPRKDDAATRAVPRERPAAKELLPRRSLALTSLAGGVFVVAVALLYGSTMAPSPRDGLQPVEYDDPAFYSVLGRDLATTGTETNLLPSGFTDLPGLPAQTWYHWGELWLGAMAITIFGAAPIAARHFIVLPLVLLAAAALTGTLVRRFGKTSSRRAYVFGFLACLFLAPIPLIPGPFFSSWAVGLIFGITEYGLGAVAVLMALYCIVVINSRTASWPLCTFIGAAAAFILPAHIAFAALGIVGLVTGLATWSIQSVLVSRRLPPLSPMARRCFATTAIALVTSAVWGVLTDHGLGGSGGFPPNVTAFNASWAGSVALTLIGTGAILSIPLAWFLARRDAPLHSHVYLGTLALLVAGAVGWGARLGDFTMFHLFFGAIAAFVTPVAAVAAWAVWDALRKAKHRRVAVVAALLCVVQLEAGVVTSTVRLEGFGPGDYDPIPVTLLAAIRQLPQRGELAYACNPLEETAFANPGLVSIDAHTGRRVIPMCFEADVPSTLIGAPLSLEAPHPAFAWAPQRQLYPTSVADPSSADVESFLRSHGIDYIYADGRHPNSLVPGANQISRSGDAEVLKIP